MALMPHGTTVVFTKSGFTARLRSVDGPNQAVDKLDSSYLGSTYMVREFTPGMMDPGEVTLEVIFDPDQLYAHNPFSDAYGARGWSDAATVLETITITHPPKVGQTSGATSVASGFITAHGQTGRIGELMTATLTFAASGPWTYTAGA